MEHFLEIIGGVWLGMFVIVFTIGLLLRHISKVFIFLGIFLILSVGYLGTHKIPPAPEHPLCGQSCK